MAEKNLYTVVVADDEDELREAVCAMIPWEALGFHLVGSASNGLDALDVFRFQRGNGHRHEIASDRIDARTLLKASMAPLR